MKHIDGLKNLGKVCLYSYKQFKVTVENVFESRKFISLHPYYKNKIPGSAP